MKKLLIAVLISMILSNVAFAYNVRTSDKYAYSGDNGKLKKDELVKGVFDIDLEKGQIKEISTVVRIGGKDIDLAKTNPGIWDIISQEGGNIVAIKIMKDSEQIITFRNDGIYYIFQVFHNIPIIDVKNFNSFFWGTYEKE